MPLISVKHSILENSRILVEVTNCSGLGYLGRVAGPPPSPPDPDDGVEPPCSIIFSLRCSHPRFFFHRGGGSLDREGGMPAVVAASDALWRDLGLPPRLSPSGPFSRPGDLPLVAREELADGVLPPGDRRVLVLEVDYAGYLDALRPALGLGQRGAGAAPGGGAHGLGPPPRRPLESPVLYVTYKRLGDERGCVQAAAKWLAAVSHAYDHWRRHLLQEVGRLEKRRRAAPLAAAPPPDNASEAEEGGEGGIAPLRHRVIPPALGEGVFWDAADPPAGGSESNSHVGEEEAFDAASLHALAWFYEGIERDKGGWRSRFTPFAASLPRQIGRDARKLFGEARVGGGAVIVPLRAALARPLQRWRRRAEWVAAAAQRASAESISVASTIDLHSERAFLSSRRGLPAPETSMSAGIMDNWSFSPVNSTQGPRTIRRGEGMGGSGEKESGHSETDQSLSWSSAQRHMVAHPPLYDSPPPEGVNAIEGGGRVREGPLSGAPLAPLRSSPEDRSLLDATVCSESANRSQGNGGEATLLLPYSSPQHYHHVLTALLGRVTPSTGRMGLPSSELLPAAGEPLPYAETSRMEGGKLPTFLHPTSPNGNVDEVGGKGEKSVETRTDPSTSLSARTTEEGGEFVVQEEKGWLGVPLHALNSLFLGCSPGGALQGLLDGVRGSCEMAPTPAMLLQFLQRAASSVGEALQMDHIRLLRRITLPLMIIVFIYILLNILITSLSLNTKTWAYMQ